MIFESWSAELVLLEIPSPPVSRGVPRVELFDWLPKTMEDLRQLTATGVAVNCLKSSMVFGSQSKSSTRGTPRLTGGEGISNNTNSADHDSKIMGASHRVRRAGGPHD